MHLNALAPSILKMIVDTAKSDNASRVLEVELEVGEVCPMDVNHIIPLMTLLARDTIARDMKVKVTEVKAKIQCSACSTVGPAVIKGTADTWEHRTPVLECSRCGSDRTIVLEGTELKVKSIKVA